MIKLFHYFSFYRSSYFISFVLITIISYDP